jgi:hypothetical protein
MKSKTTLCGLAIAVVLQLGVLAACAQTLEYLYSGTETNVTLNPGTCIITAYGAPGGGDINDGGGGVGINGGVGENGNLSNTNGGGGVFLGPGGIGPGGVGGTNGGGGAGGLSKVTGQQGYGPPGPRGFLGNGGVGFNYYGMSL